MKNLNGKVVILSLIGILSWAPLATYAQDDAPRYDTVKRRIFNHFDYNKDGVLNDREKYHARKAYARWKESHDITPRRDTRIRTAARRLPGQRLRD